MKTRQEAVVRHRADTMTRGLAIPDALGCPIAKEGSTAGRSGNIAREAADVFMTSLADSGMQLVSGFVVGSQARNSDSQRLCADLDLRGVVQAPSCRGIALVDKCMQDLCDRAASPQLAVQCGNRLGVERCYLQTPSLMIHYCVMTTAILKSLPSQHKRAYAREYRLLSGRDLLLQFRSLQVNTHDLLLTSRVWCDVVVLG